MDRRLKVAVGRGSWHKELAAALDARIGNGAPVEYDVVDIDAHDWQERIAPYDLIIWNGRFLGPASSGHYKEKVYFIERVLNKLVVPNCATTWHYDSKVAQSYLFAHARVPTPPTVASLDYDDARSCLDRAAFPIVAKRSNGASSANVRLVADRRHARKWLDGLFFQELWDRHKDTHPNRMARAATAPWHSWFRPKVMERLVRSDRHGVVYWQEYVPGNDADLRITVIGDRYALGYWRRNRPGDFRASGSGLLDYKTPLPEPAVRRCMELSHHFGFDSMAYDIVFRGDELVILEMSYTYVDKYLLDAPGHFVLDDQGALAYQEGHVAPQDLWVEWALLKAFAHQ